jgi:hypothetical protein
MQHADFAMQAPLQSCWSLGHWLPHWPRLQVALPPTGTGHGAQAAPQALTESSATQSPPQFCVSAGQDPEHAAVASMQVPLQSTAPLGHDVPHATPSQVAWPPMGAVHGEQP